MNKYLVLTLSLLAIPTSQAAAATGFIEQFKMEIILALAVAVCIIALLVLMVCLYALRVFLKAASPVEEVVETESVWSKFMSSMTRVVPIEQEHEVLTDHEYDGIKELDNQLPPWWLYGFYFTIFFAVAYLLYFHVLGYGMSSSQEYESEMVQAKDQVAVYLASLENNIDESNAVLTDDAADLAEAKGLFTQYCVACHGQLGEGGVGPNLTDAYWIHGGDVPSIFKTIKYGVPQKGMISWQNQLNPKQMQSMASYILTFQGTNPPNAKEAQGDLFVSAEKPQDSITPQ